MIPLALVRLLLFSLLWKERAQQLLCEAEGQIFKDKLRNQGPPHRLATGHLNRSHCHNGLCSCGLGTEAVKLRGAVSFRFMSVGLGSPGALPPSSPIFTRTRCSSLGNRGLNLINWPPPQGEKMDHGSHWNGLSSSLALPSSGRHSFC